MCFRVESIRNENMEITVWKYTVKSAVHGTWKYTVKSTVHAAWQWYGEYSINLLTKNYTDLRDGTRPDSHVTALSTFDIVKDEIAFWF